MIAQIDQKRLAKQANRNVDLTAQREEERLRSENVKSLIAMKLDAMRNSRIPEKVIQDVERKLERL